MKERLIIFLLIFSLTVNVAALVTMGYYWGRYDSNGIPLLKGDETPSPRLIRELSLDKEQRGKMRDMRRSLLNEIDPIRNELNTKREDLVDLLTTAEPDRSALDQKLSEINTLQSRIQYAAVDNLIREKEFLNPSQQEQYFNFISKRLCRSQMPMGRGAKSFRTPRTMRGQEPGAGMGYDGGRGRGRMRER